MAYRVAGAFIKTWPRALARTDARLSQACPLDRYVKDDAMARKDARFSLACPEDRYVMDDDAAGYWLRSLTRG